MFHPRRLHYWAAQQTGCTGCSKKTVNICCTLSPRNVLHNLMVQRVYIRYRQTKLLHASAFSCDHILIQSCVLLGNVLFSVSLLTYCFRCHISIYTE